MQYLLPAPQVLIGPAGQRFDNGAVLVQGESIVAVGGHDEVRAAAGADLVELAFPAATIMPGLINAHVHLAFNVGPDRLEKLTAPVDEPRLALAMAGRAQQVLNCGVTTVRGLGDRGGLTVALRESIKAGELAGPRILAATAPRAGRAAALDDILVRQGATWIETAASIDAATVVRARRQTAPGRTRPPRWSRSGTRPRA
ncbi:MAG: amidohydrolase family protein [Actinomycetota bacterium]|nr:amidohydrolase family protein [Actinomycetota bacterium]